jgi:quercetin dioxygenase-like cupin family protein
VAAHAHPDDLSARTSGTLGDRGDGCGSGSKKPGAEHGCIHRHPYDETWIVLDGTVNFQAANETRAAGPGDVVIVPANTPHKFTNDGPNRSRLVCIHANPTVIGERLE